MKELIIIGVSSFSFLSIIITIIILYMNASDDTLSSLGLSSLIKDSGDSDKDAGSLSNSGNSGNSGNGGCTRGTNVTTHGTTYDACDLETKAKEFCGKNDGRWVYDAYWDSRMARGASCGTSQSAYGNGVKWENVCSKLKSGNYKYSSLGCS